MAANEDRIGKRSYELWEQEGRPLGERHAILAAGVQEIAASAEADGGAVKNSRAKKPGPQGRNCSRSPSLPAKPKVALRSLRRPRHRCRLRRSPPASPNAAENTGERFGYWKKRGAIDRAPLEQALERVWLRAA